MRTPEQWDRVFMAVARAVALRSKDPSTQVGAILVDPEWRVISTGFNGPPSAIPDSQVPWSRPEKYPWIMHAEENALWFGAEARGVDGLVGSTIFASGKPCSRCVLRAVRAKVARIVFGDVAPIICDDQDWSLAQEIARLGGLNLAVYTHDG